MFVFRKVNIQQIKLNFNYLLSNISQNFSYKIYNQNIKNYPDYNFDCNLNKFNFKKFKFSSHRNFKNNLISQYIHITKDKSIIKKQNSLFSYLFFPQKKIPKKFKKTNKRNFRKFFILLKKISELLLISIFLYIFYNNKLIKNIINKLFQDFYFEIKKLLQQLYIGQNLSYIINDILCDFLEDPRFVQGIDNMIMGVYRDEYLITYIKNLFYEVFSIFLKEINFGSIIYTLLVNLVYDRNFTTESIKFFRNYFASKNIDNYIEEYIMNIFEDSRFKNYFSFFIKTHFLYMLQKPSVRMEIKYSIANLLSNESIFQMFIEQFYLRYNSNHLKRLQKYHDDPNILKNLNQNFDNNNYLNVIKFDLEDKTNIDDILTLKLIDFFDDDKYKYSHKKDLNDYNNLYLEEDKKVLEEWDKKNVDLDENDEEYEILKDVREDEDGYVDE